MDPDAFVDPSQQTPLFVAQQVTCAYPVSDFYANLPRFLYYAVLISCLLIRWHPWLGDALLGAAATYAGVAAIEAFILVQGFPYTKNPDNKNLYEWISVPYIDPASLVGNKTYAALPNLYTNHTSLPIYPAAYEYDIDAILAICVTGWLFLLPIHCWSTSIRGRRARHVLLGLWNILMLCATVCSLVLWVRLSNVPWQYRFCYPRYPDLDSVTNDGWQNSIWQGDWNSTIWHTFGDPSASQALTENCIYPCFKTSQVLRRPQSIVASLLTNTSPRTDNSASDSALAHQTHLMYFMYATISLSSITALIVFVLNATGLDRIGAVPIDRPWRLWTDRALIRNSVEYDIRNFIHRTKRKRRLKSEKETLGISYEEREQGTRRRKSLFRLCLNLVALIILFIVVVVIPTTWLVFVVWIEWWIRRDIVSQETPRQVGQWASAASVGLVLFSALVLRLKYWLATKVEIEDEIDELRHRISDLELLREKKM